MDGDTLFPIEHYTIPSAKKASAGASAAPSLAVRAEAAASPRMVRVAPDKHAWCPAPGEKMPEYVICRWSKSADGLCRPIPVPMNMARVTADLLVLLGFGGTHRKQTFHTLRRLATAGFVEMVHVSPGVWMLDLDSWFRHVAECVDNPDRWEEGGEDLRSYKFANGLGGWKK